MAQSTMSIRIDNDVKRGFDKFCDDVGMNASVAINMFVRATLRDNRLPFNVSSVSDPFYSDANINFLRRAIADVKAGRATLTEHELIEVDDD